MPSTPKSTSIAGERSYHHGDLRRTLLEHGWEAIVEAGGKDISLREVARRAGVSPGASFHHFRNKEALLAAVAVEGFSRLTLTRQKRTRAIGDPEERLRIVLHAYVEFAVKNPAVFFLMFRFVTTPSTEAPDVMAAALASFHALRAAIADITGISETHATATVDAWAAWAAMHGAASLLAGGPETRTDHSIPAKRLIDRTVQMVLDGLGKTRSDGKLE